MKKSFWNAKFSQKKDLYGTEPNEFFKEKLTGLETGRLLVPGEGEGRNAIYAASLGWEVTAFDISEVARENAIEKAGSLGLQLDYQLANAGDFNYGRGKFDCAALIYFHLDPKIRREIHQKIADSIKPGGYLIMEVFHPKQLEYLSGGPKNEDLLYTVNMLQKDFVGWEILEKAEVETRLNEGIGHSGKGYVTRLFARKGS